MQTFFHPTYTSRIQTAKSSMRFGSSLEEMAKCAFNDIEIAAKRYGRDLVTILPPQQIEVGTGRHKKMVNETPTQTIIRSILVGKYDAGTIMPPVAHTAFTMQPLTLTTTSGIYENLVQRGVIAIDTRLEYVPTQPSGTAVRTGKVQKLHAYVLTDDYVRRAYGAKYTPNQRKVVTQIRRHIVAAHRHAAKNKLVTALAPRRVKTGLQLMLRDSIEGVEKAFQHPVNGVNLEKSSLARWEYVDFVKKFINWAYGLHPDWPNEKKN